MARPYSVTPVLRPGRRFYVATFRTSSGARTTRGLGTEDKHTAELICAGLQLLGHHKPTDRTQVVWDVSEKALQLFFEKEESAEDKDGVSGSAAPWLAEVDGRREEVRILRHANEQLREQLEEEKSKREALERSMLGRLATAGQRCPPMADALSQFETHMKAKTATHNAKVLVSVARRFVEGLPTERARPLDVLPADVETFLDAHVAQGKPDKRQARRDAMRRRVGRFLAWCASTWDYPSQMDRVPTVGRLAVARERGDIHWHAETEVEAALKALPQRLKAARPKAKPEQLKRQAVYWRALVGTLAYAGLNPSELIWLRRADLETWTEAGETRARFWVTTVEDPQDPTVRHLLKTDHRRRGVNVHPRRLWPLLKGFLDASLAGEHFLFPMPEGWRRRRRKAQRGAAERWAGQSLSVALRGHEGGKRRKPTPGLLPEGMTAQSLRRTFGSLRLREGLTTAEVAAEMGNTEDVVRTHYARILGKEVRSK